MINHLTNTGQTIRFSKTVQAQLLKHKLRSLTMKCGFAVSAHARAIHDFELMKKVGAAYGLYQIKDAKLQNACEVVYQLAEEKFVAAGQYGYTADDLNELKNCLEQHSLYVQEQLKIAENKKNAAVSRQSFSGWNHRPA